MMIALTTIELKVQELIESELDHMDYELVRVRMSDQFKRSTLQIMLDRKDGKPVVIKDCEKASHHISALLDVDDVISDKYDLEVSSPGVDRPLTRLKDFTSHQGFHAKVELHDAIDGRRRFKAVIGDVKDDAIAFTDIAGTAKDSEESFITVAPDNIMKAKLILTDELIAANEQAKAN